MTFLQPSILWGLPLLLIPVIIHLLNRLRHRPQPWAAMRFLRAANQTSISQAKLRQFLVLLLRVLAVAALILFLSRPMAGGWLGWALSPAPEVVVLILDRSASMEQQAGPEGLSRRETALRLWAEALQPFQQSRLVLLDSATRTPREIPGVRALAGHTLAGPSDTRADLPGLLQSAFGYLSQSRSGAAEVWIASDLQESNWLPADPRWGRVMTQFGALRQKTRFRLLSFAEGGPRNLAVSLAEAVRRSRGDQRHLDMVVDVQQNGTGAEPVILNWKLGSAASQTEVKMTGPSLRWRDRLPLPASNEAGWGTIEIGADGNLADNTLYFAFGQERNPAALVVSDLPVRDLAALRLAAADLGRTQVEPAAVSSAAEFSGVPLTNIALIVWNAATLPGAAPNLLEQFVASGGSLLFIPPAASPPAFSFGGLGFGEVTTARSNTFFSVSNWNDLEGPFAKTEEGFGVPLPALEVSRRAALPGTAAALASFADGAPFLVRRAIGKGEVYFCATATDPGWSSLSDGAVLVPMLQRLISAGARRVNTAVMVECGEARETEGWTRVEGDRSSDPQLKAGIYQAGTQFIAVNRAAAENDLARISSESARSLFGSLPFQMHEERTGAGDRLQGEIWRLFVLAMLAFLIVEGWLIMPQRVPGSGAVRPPRPQRQEVLA